MFPRPLGRSVEVGARVGETQTFTWMQAGALKPALTPGRLKPISSGTKKHHFVVGHLLVREANLASDTNGNGKNRPSDSDSDPAFHVQGPAEVVKSPLVPSQAGEPMPSLEPLGSSKIGSE